MSPEELVRLEAMAFRSWPAATVVEHRGMLLRFTGGESRRANSAAVHACQRGLEADEVVATAEAFYGARGQRALLQVGPTAPPFLDEALSRRGYEREAPVCVQTAPLAVLVSRMRAQPGEAQARVAPEPDEDWIEVEITRGRYAGIASTFLDVLARLRPRAGFATARVDGRPAAACLLVHEGDLVVLAAMRTVAESRRRGAATSLLRAGTAWASERGAATVLLQVEDGNVPALSLYAAHGFATQYRYHYRGQAPGPGRGETSGEANPAR